jgi:DNA-binding transcriptional ArsR family regulator
METLFLLAHPVRWRIIEILASGEHAAGQIADAVHSERGIGREGVSKHLNRLARAGLVTSRVDQNARVYRMSPRVIGALAGLVEHLLARRASAHYDELDLDGREIDRHDAESPRSLDEDDEAGCWCIRKAEEIGAI